MSAVPIHKMTEEEYLLFEEQSNERHEYYQGEVFAMAGGTIEHAQVSGNALGEIRQQLKGKPCQAFGSDLRIQIEAYELYTYPDVSIVCGEVERFKGRRDTILNPVAIIEVLSKDTEQYDRGDKFEFYRAIPTLKEYILISSRKMLVEQFIRAENKWVLGIYNQPDDQLRLESVGIAIQISELYDRMRLLQA